MNQSAFHMMALHTGELILAHARGDRDTPQSAWRQAVQGQFLDWLGAGGFHSARERGPEAAAAEEMFAAVDVDMDLIGRTNAKNENSGKSAAVLTSRPGTQCEELKFTRVRIDDAVE